MPVDDIRISDWSLLASAGTTQTLQFTSPDALTSLSVYTGGTVTDVDDLTDATEHAAVLSGGDLIATVNLDVPTGRSVPLRLVVNGAVQSVGRLHPSTMGAAGPDNTIALTAGVNEFELTILGVVESGGGGGGGGAPTNAGYLVTVAHVDLTAAVVVGATPGGELGGTWAAPTVDATHSGSSHAGVQAAAEATAASALSAHAADTTAVHGIADTSALVLTSDARLSDARTPTAHATSHQDGGTDELALDGSQITTGTVADARIPATIARDAEVAAGYQPLDADLTALAAAGNSAVLAATTASFLTADETKLDGIEAGAEVNDTAAEILTKLLTVDGAGSGLDADLLDGLSSAAFETPAGAQAKADAKVTQTITNGVTTTAPSEDAVFDALALKADDSAVAHDTGDETWAGVKTFSSDPIIPDEVYGAGWNGSLEPPTKNAVYDKIETLGGGGTAVIGDWSALGNLGATETVTGVDNTFVRSAGTLDQACTVTIATTADQVIDLQLTQDATGGRAATFSGVDVWLTQLGTAPDLSTAPAGAVHHFRFFDIGGTCYGMWLTEPPVEAFSYAISDETTAITTGAGKITFRAPFACSLVGARASLTTASSSGIPTFDVNESGTTLLSTKLTIDANEKTSTTAATPVVISDNLIADDAEMTIDVDVAGTGAAGAKVTLYLRRR